jgi:cell division protein FtsZ
MIAGLERAEVVHGSTVTEPVKFVPTIKVIGIGKCGLEAVNYISKQGLAGVELIAIDSDAEALRRNHATTQLKISQANTQERDLRFDLDVSFAMAANSRAQIKELLSGADIVVVIAGMGGSTGTGAASVIAQIARELKILSIAIVTQPLPLPNRLRAYEGNRERFAREGIKLCHIYADALIVLPNPPLEEAETAIPECYKPADGLIYQFVSGLTRLLNNPSAITIDLSDLRWLLLKSGLAKIGSGIAARHHRARIATEIAIGKTDISGAKGILVNIISDGSLRLGELTGVMECIQLNADHPKVIQGITIDETMGEELRVTIMATGFNLSRHLYSGDSK